VPKEHEMPTRENCDPSDPDEMFWWMFVCMPELRGGLALMVWEYYRLMSRRLHDLGARIKCDECGHQAEPKLKLRLPTGTMTSLTGGGKWVPIDTPDPVQDEAKDIVRKLPAAARAELNAALDAIKAEEAMQRTEEE
jgi:hypothetical protein